MPAPDTGRLRDAVRFERRRIGASDRFGNAEGDWEVVVTRRAASIEPMRGGEQVQAARLAGVSGFEIWVRWDRTVAALKTNVRLVDLRDPSRIFNVRWGPQDLDGDREWLLMHADLGVAT